MTQPDRLPARSQRLSARRGVRLRLRRQRRPRPAAGRDAHRQPALGRPRRARHGRPARCDRRRHRRIVWPAAPRTRRASASTTDSAPWTVGARAAGRGLATRRRNGSAALGGYGVVDLTARPGASRRSGGSRPSCSTPSTIASSRCATTRDSAARPGSACASTARVCDMRRAACLLAFAGLALLSLAAAAAAVSVHDDRGATLVFPEPPRRIVSLLPSLTESVCALGACERLVGVDRFSTGRRRSRALPKLGGLDDAQIERIVALGPTSCWRRRSARVVDRLESLGVRVLVLESRDRADVRRTLDRARRACSAAAAAPTARVWARIERDAARRRRGACRPGCAASASTSRSTPTPYAAGAGSFVDETAGAARPAQCAAGRARPAFRSSTPNTWCGSSPTSCRRRSATLAAMPRSPGLGGAARAARRADLRLRRAIASTARAARPAHRRSRVARSRTAWPRCRCAVAPP